MWWRPGWPVSPFNPLHLFFIQKLSSPHLVLQRICPRPVLPCHTQPLLCPGRLCVICWASSFLFYFIHSISLFYSPGSSFGSPSFCLLFPLCFRHSLHCFLLSWSVLHPISCRLLAMCTFLGLIASFGMNPFLIIVVIYGGGGYDSEPPYVSLLRSTLTFRSTARINMQPS